MTKTNMQEGRGYITRKRICALLEKKKVGMDEHRQPCTMAKLHHANCRSTSSCPSAHRVLDWSETFACGS